MSRHMHFHREIDQLKKMILDLGVLVEDRLRRACTILETNNEAEAQAIMNSDWEVDDTEIRVEEDDHMLHRTFPTLDWPLLLT